MDDFLDLNRYECNLTLNDRYADPYDEAVKYHIHWLISSPINSSASYRNRMLGLLDRVGVVGISLLYS